MSMLLTTTSGTPPAIGPAGGLGAHLPAFLGWLVGHQRCSPHTVRAYTRDLTEFVTFCQAAGVATVEAVSVPAVEAFVATRRPGSSAANRALAALRSFFRWCRRHGLGATGAADDALGVPGDHRLPVYLTAHEQDAVLEGLGGDESDLGRRDHALVALLLATGLRASEAVMLEAADVDLERRVVRVRHGKGRREREAVIAEPLVPALAAWLPVRARLARGPWFLCTARGGRLSTQAVYLVFQSKVSRLAGRHVHPHVARHSHASRLVEHGADLGVVQRQLGHSRLDTTRQYAHVSTVAQRVAIDRFWRDTFVDTEGRNQA